MSELIYRRECEHGESELHDTGYGRWCNGHIDVPLDPDKVLVIKERWVDQETGLTLGKDLTIGRVLDVLDREAK